MPSISEKVQLFVNGKRVPQGTARRFPFTEDKIFVFESLRSYGGVIFLIEEHLERLFESAKTVGLKIPKSRACLKDELKACLAGHSGKDAFLRLAVDEQDSYIWILDRRRPKWIYERGLDLKTSVIRRNHVDSEPPEAKTNAFFNNVLATIDLAVSRSQFSTPSPLSSPPERGRGKGEGDDAIFLDSSGYVTEATIWNLFMVKGEILFTPQTGALNGVTRKFVIKCAQQYRIPVAESNLTRHDIWNADEAFLTNTSGEIVPIRSLDGRHIGNEVPGPMVKRLRSQFARALKGQLKKPAVEEIAIFNGELFKQEEFRKEIVRRISELHQLAEINKLQITGSGAALLTTAGNPDKRKALVLAAIPILVELAKRDQRGQYQQSVIWSGENAKALKDLILAKDNGLTDREKGLVSKIVNFKPGTVDTYRTVIEDHLKEHKTIASSVTQEEAQEMQDTISQILSMIESVDEVNGLSLEPVKIAEAAEAYVVRTLLLIDLAAFLGDLGIKAERLKKPLDHNIQVLIRQYFSEQFGGFQVSFDQQGNLQLTIAQVVQHLANLKQAEARITSAA